MKSTPSEDIVDLETRIKRGSPVEWELFSQDYMLELLSILKRVAQ